MTVFASLRSRIFVASAILAVLAIGVAIYVVNILVTRQAEIQLQREARETAAIVEQLRTTRVDTFRIQARLLADLPKLKAAVGTDDPPTVQDIAAEYRQQLGANLFVITDAQGRVLAEVGARPETARAVAQQPSVQAALHGRESLSLLSEADGLLQVITVPVDAVTRDRPGRDLLGTLTVGFLMDDELARQLKQITGSEIAFGMDGRVLASTLPRPDRAALSPLLAAGGIGHVRIGGDEYVALPKVLRPSSASAAGAPVALILRSRTEHLRFLDAIHTALGLTAVLAVALAIVVSFAVARTITRPLAAITDVMRDVAATGDLTRKIAARKAGAWADADAQLLASTFNTLTDSIARFQREMSQKERLSSLGRMSTVIAHEIRNPLMIIKAALHGLRRPEISQDAMREAMADIDEEVARLNRIVNEVLDFARPIQFELATIDLNALGRESAAAAEANGPGVPIALDLDPAMPPVTLDPERLRQALVNMLVNARHAVEAAPPRPGGSAEAPVTLRTRALGARVSIAVLDRGIGIDPHDLPRVFDPYFTTKRGGSGLGLAISKNIVEGLGGTIAVSSERGRGTEIRIELPKPRRPSGTGTRSA